MVKFIKDACMWVKAPVIKPNIADKYDAFFFLNIHLWLMSPYMLVEIERHENGDILLCVIIIKMIRLNINLIGYVCGICWWWWCVEIIS